MRRAVIKQAFQRCLALQLPAQLHSLFLKNIHNDASKSIQYLKWRSTLYRASSHHVKREDIGQFRTQWASPFIKVAAKR